MKQNCFIHLCKSPILPLWFGGSSEAIELAAEQVDTYLSRVNHLPRWKKKLIIYVPKAAAKGRTLNYGIRLHVIVRETNEQAWAAADELIQYLDDATIAAAQKKFAQMDSVGQQRMAALHGGQ